MIGQYITTKTDGKDDLYINGEDPFHDVIVSADSLYRLEENVFAEPLSSHLRKHDNEYDTYERRIDKVTVENKKNKIYKRYHIDVEASSCICPQQNCGKTYKTPTLLKAHIRKVHCAECVFMCEVCGKSFTAQYLLKRNTAVHEARKVECPVCKKRLSKRTSLSVHLLSHTNTRRHECGVCHKRFLLKSTMKNHSKFVHNIDKEFLCEKCMKRYRIRHDFVKHKCEENVAFIE